MISVEDRGEEGGGEGVGKRKRRREGWYHVTWLCPSATAERRYVETACDHVSTC